MIIITKVCELNITENIWFFNTNILLFGCDPKFKFRTEHSNAIRNECFFYFKMFLSNLSLKFQMGRGVV